MGTSHVLFYGLTNQILSPLRGCLGDEIPAQGAGALDARANPRHHPSYLRRGRGPNRSGRAGAGSRAYVHLGAAAVGAVEGDAADQGPVFAPGADGVLPGCHLCHDSVGDRRDQARSGLDTT